MAENIWNPEEDEGVEIPIEDDDSESETKSESESDSETKPEAEPEDLQAEEPDESEDAEDADEADDSEESEESEEPEGIEEAEGSEAEAGAEKTEKKGFFGRKKNKEKEKLEQQVADLTDRLKRNMAEFDNYRKRTDKEKASMYIIGARDIVEEILPVVDSFERGLATAQEGDAFAEGMRMVYRQLMTSLEKVGVKPIETVGKPFDPNLHNAVMHVDDESVGENIIVEEFQKGYTYKDFVVRHSMVKVAN